MTNQPFSFREKLRLLSDLKEFSSWLPEKTKRRGKCQDVIIDRPDLSIFPILKCWPADGGRFITLPCVHTVDPESGSANLGMYRMQVFGPDMTGMHWHRHKTGANHFLKYKRAGKRMPVSVSLGGDPVYTYAATAPMPENMDEYLLAGFLRRKGVKLVKCITNGLFVPEDADIVMEGYVDPDEDYILEGPFGDHTGFYSLADYYPKFHITCITHRKDAVFPATIVGVPPMEDAWIGKATERLFLSPIRMAMVPEILDMDLPFAGTAHNIAVVKIRKSYPGQAQKVMHSLWGAGQMMLNKIMIVVDDGFDIHDYPGLISNGFERFHPKHSLHFSTGPLDILDHSSSFFAFGSKLGIDLTVPMEGELPAAVDDQEPQVISVAGMAWCSEVNNLYRELKLPVLIVGIEKDNSYTLKELIENIEKQGHWRGIKLILLVDNGVGLSDYFTLIWLVGANLDPKRDVHPLFLDGSPSILIDATMKTHPHDHFKRDWPNVVISDQATIRSMDEKWEKLGLGAFIPSPSLRFAHLVKNEGAISLKNRNI